MGPQLPAGYSCIVGGVSDNIGVRGVLEALEELSASAAFRGQVGFGMGVHHCLGAHLGRLEARVALEWLVPQLLRFECALDTVRWNDNWFVRGPEVLPMRWKSH